MLSPDLGDVDVACLIQDGVSSAPARPGDVEETRSPDLGVVEVACLIQDGVTSGVTGEGLRNLSFLGELALPGDEGETISTSDAGEACFEVGEDAASCASSSSIMDNGARKSKKISSPNSDPIDE
jgi:hypothetical protein